MRLTSFCWMGVLVGCAGTASGPRGGTYAEHAGNIQVVVTNATPQRLCELQMSFEDQRSMGDNWLPAGGLPSGKSAEFKVRPGKYQATWSTCKEGDKHFYAGTLIADTAVDVTQQTQLFIYVPDTVAPTKRASVLTRDYKIVHFTGQPIGPIDRSAPAVAQVDHFAKMEASMARGSAPPKKTDEPRFEKFSAKDMIDPKAKRTKKRGIVKPSLNRKHDVAAANVK